jgi:hypothetical protein
VTSNATKQRPLPFIKPPEVWSTALGGSHAIDAVLSNLGELDWLCKDSLTEAYLFEELLFP